MNNLLKQTIINTVERNNVILTRHTDLERAHKAAKRLTAKEQTLIDFLNGKTTKKSK